PESIETWSRNLLISLNTEFFWQGRRAQQTDEATTSRYFKEGFLGRKPIGAIERFSKIRAIAVTHVNPGLYAHINGVIKGAQDIGNFLANPVSAGTIGDWANSQIRCYSVR